MGWWAGVGGLWQGRCTVQADLINTLLRNYTYKYYKIVSLLLCSHYSKGCFTLYKVHLNGSCISLSNIAKIKCSYFAKKFTTNILIAKRFKFSWSSSPALVGCSDNFTQEHTMNTHYRLISLRINEHR